MNHGQNTPPFTPNPTESTSLIKNIRDSREILTLNSKSNGLSSKNESFKVKPILKTYQ